MAAAKSFEALTKDREAMDSTGFALTQPFRTIASRCHRRFVDYQRLVIDVQNAAAVNGPKAILKPSEAKLMMRERWLLYAQCLESEVGHEPANPYLYGRYK
ncbi:hypothetical protein FNF27_04451 [Cafeteria roenbergensis]|uniref:Uncharacterized protein n=1 Tax=Cafeteria roenbergensis TaxID=33653 RepID=A0A5A8CSU0_CAFRO|nr:hypothetical protein FNF29_04978 [Cafeteria roenbergensis]KAA0152258.1 hypothetical protein FNF28_07056 [Cafeteria roenbergensis]KAA0156133.1 hypothetical protein FNF31_05955 [Cafeteria roenbergensis]KAA0174065.1 hypothetical protein FNF27_04451 [Cafeteria roenbergensis]|eukprot:KAA0150864.1 hypothetical protein FNF29_04978 [Cafeteria roenbergensis]